MLTANITSQLLSPARWRKVRLLAQERWLRVRHRLTNKTSTTPGTDSRLVEHRWHYSSAVPMPRELFESSTDTYHQDTWQDGIMSTELDYAVLEVPGASVITNEISHRSIYDASDNLMPEVSFRLKNHRAAVRRPIAVTREVTGLTASLYGNVAMAGGNYGHWLIDGLSRILLIEKHYELSDFDHFLVPPLKYDFHRESLLALGIEAHQIIEIEALECLRFERLVVSTSPRGTSSALAPSWLIEGFRERFLGQFPPTRSDRRIYISRRDAGSRNFDNEDEIVALLEAHGFEIIELSKHGFESKLGLFAEAEIVVGLSGAGMANVIFCSPSASLIEFQPTSLSAYTFASAATWLGMDTRYILFDSQSLASKVNRYYGDLHLDTSLIEAQLQQIEANRHAAPAPADAERSDNASR